jgi:hypothetical protein
MTQGRILWTSCKELVNAFEELLNQAITLVWLFMVV